MPKGANQKLKLLYLAQILTEETDDEHSLTMKEIIARLEGKGVGAERRSLYKDMAALKMLDIEVTSQKRGRDTAYNVTSKKFELAELKLLVDVILASRFITEKKSKELIRKLIGFASKYEAEQLKRQVVVAGRIKTMNESIYYSVDTLHNAIAKDSQITFEYLHWDLNKKLVPKRKELYCVSPWALTWADENYYLVAYDPNDPKKDKMRHYRVDKIRKIEMTGKKREGKEQYKTMNMATYAPKNFGMFKADEETVRLAFKNEIVGVLIDRFGKDIIITKSEREGWSETEVKVSVSNVFLGWLFELGTDVKLLGPEDVVGRYKNEIRRVMSEY